MLSALEWESVKLGKEASVQQPPESEGLCLSQPVALPTVWIALTTNPKPQSKTLTYLAEYESGKVLLWCLVTMFWLFICTDCYNP